MDTVKLRRETDRRWLVDVYTEDGVTTVGVIERQGSLPSMAHWVVYRWVDGFDGGTRAEQVGFKYQSRKAALAALMAVS